MTRDRYFIRAALALAIGSACGGLAGGLAEAAEPVAAESSAAESSAAEPLAAEPVAVTVVAVQQETIRRTTTQPATVHAYFTAEIDARVSGYAKAVKADIGDRVARGDVLVEIDVPELEMKTAVARASVDSAAAKARRADAQVILAEANRADAEASVGEAAARIAAARAELTAAEAEYARTKQMVETGSLQERLLDESTQRRDAARANVEAAEAVVVKARSRVDVAAAAVEAARAEAAAAAATTRVAHARLDEARVMLGFARVAAPFDGVVTHRSVDPGDLVRAATDAPHAPLFVVKQIDRTRIRTSVPELDAPLVDVGDEVVVKLSSAALAPVRGKVTRTGGSLDPSTRTMTVEVEADNAGGKLLPGMYGEATIVLHENAGARTLPASAVRFSETGDSFVYAVDESGAVEVVPVVLGYDDGTRIEVLSPLAAGRRVVDAHLKRFRDGDRVRVLE